MDANKDEAVKCLNIAMNFLAINRSRALKFLNKARRLDPSIEIDEFLSLQPEAKNPNPNPNPNETTKEKPPLNPLPTSSEQEQVQVRVAKRKKDYYDILGVGKNSNAEDIRKAYRKLSLKVHPDKNWATGAEDSFKKLSNAFQCLSNTESRRRYDLQTSPVSVSGNSNKVSVSRRRSSSSRVDSDVVIHLIFRVGAKMFYSLGQPFTMKVLMRVARSKAEFYRLSGSCRLKYEYEGKIIFLPKEDELGADNELRTCMHRWLSLRQEPVVIRAEFI